MVLELFDPVSILHSAAPIGPAFSVCEDEDFSGKVLGFSMGWVTFLRCNFDNCEMVLRDSRAYSCHFQECTFRGTTFGRGMLEECIFEGCDFSRCVADHTSFTYCSLLGCFARAATFQIRNRDTHAEGCDFRNCVVSSGWNSIR